MSFALELVDIHKRFGSVVALEGASLQVRPGTVHAILGENGAGKTTLVRIAAGELAPDAGDVRVAGRPLRSAEVRSGFQTGVGMVHQHFALVPAMTVAENIALGRTGRYDATVAAQRVERLSRDTGLHVPPATLVRDLPVAVQQRVEILRALSRNAHLLILDEPTAVLAPAESDELIRWLRRFVSSDRAAVFITHRLHEAREVADELTVLRAGRVVATHESAAVSNETLVVQMIGQVLERQEPLPFRDAGPVVLALDDVSVRGDRGEQSLQDVTLAVRAGEVVGIAAVEGSGQRELLRVLSGRVAPATGRRTMPQHVGFIPEDRHRDALVLDLTLRENVALRELQARRGVMPWAGISRHAEALLREFDVRAPSIEAPAWTLSGGNQQKLVVGRELAPAPAAIVAENPTRGLDVRATAAVQSYLLKARENGAAIVLYSTDLDEVIALSDRVLVVHAGRVREVPRVRESIGRAMLGMAT